MGLFSREELKNSFEQNYHPKLILFTANIKTDLKFFQNSFDEIKNIPIGTVIGKDVISSDAFERGCASPVHFIYIYNNNRRMIINIFEVSFKKSFYYWN